MSPRGNEQSRTIEIDCPSDVHSVLFADDGKKLVSGGVEGMLRQWQVHGGKEVGKPIQVEEAEIYAAALSPDGKWFVCGMRPAPVEPDSDDLESDDSESEDWETSDGDGNGGSVVVWDALTHEQVFNIDAHTDTVFSVDISPDSTKFATGGADSAAFIWSLTTGERLVGPLERDDGWVVAVRFSPSGDRIAIATAEVEDDPRSIRIHDSNNGQQLLDIPFHVFYCISSSLAWSADGRQLFAASFSDVQRFDAYSGSLLSEWSVPSGEQSASIVLSHNQMFAVVAAYDSLTFWDISTEQQIGPAIEHASTIFSIALSPDDDYLATGEENGKITIRCLRSILPVSYMTVNVLSQLPVMCICYTTCELWTQGDLTRVEQLLSEEIAHPSNSFHHACALAQRSLLLTRSNQRVRALDDAKKSIQTQRSVVGYIASAVAYARNGEHESALRMIDLSFGVSLPNEINFLLLIKAIILFECGKHDDAILRVDDLIDIVDEQSQYLTVRAQMFFQLGSMSLSQGDHQSAIELFKRAQQAIPFRQGPYLTVISLIFGWDFDRLPATLQIHLYKAVNAADRTEMSQSLLAMVETLGEEMFKGEATAGWEPDVIQKCLARCESNGDAAVESMDFSGALVQYSTALALNPSDPMDLLIKRSRTCAVLNFWEDSLKDADDAIKVNPLSPWGYERKHAALHTLQRYDEAIHAFTRLYTLIEESPDESIRQLAMKYISPTKSETVIVNIVNGMFKMCPFVLIDVESGCLCDGPERLRIFKSELEFKELQSSLTEALDEERIQEVVKKYFRYVTLSHVWQGHEPTFQDVNLADSVWELDSSPLNEKLRKFCEEVRTAGYRWAWSDTCCIDKMIDMVLSQSLTMMYKWYQASTATFILLADVVSPSTVGNLTGSIWMTRAWTAQELLAAKAVRFYTRDWQPYLGDTRPDHKESPEIMQELADAIEIAREDIISFHPDNLTVREKLRLASTRHATVEEDVAYALIGIFKSDIAPRYGEGEAALGHLLEETVARSGEVTVLAWHGKSSSYHSCLPASLEVYSRPPGTLTAIDDAQTDARTAALRSSLPQMDAILLHDRIARLPPVRFANRRLHLPCIIFAVKKLGVLGSKSDETIHYDARVSGIGHVNFQTSTALSLTEPRRLILVHPWISELSDPLDSFSWGSALDSDSDSDGETGPGSAAVSPSDTVPMDNYTRAIRLVVRLQQPFHALLLQQQSSGKYKRIVAEHDIAVEGVDRSINLARDIRTEVVEIL